MIWLKPKRTDLEKLVLSIVLDEIGVEPSLAIGEALLGDVGWNLQSLDRFLDPTNLAHQKLVLG